MLLYNGSVHFSLTHWDSFIRQRHRLMEGNNFVFDLDCCFGDTVTAKLESVKTHNHQTIKQII